VKEMAVTEANVVVIALNKTMKNKAETLLPFMFSPITILVI